MEDTDTTEGITRNDVEEAMHFLGVHNPKPEIPLETTLTGHQLVAMARQFSSLDVQLQVIEDRLALLEERTAGIRPLR